MKYHSLEKIKFKFCSQFSYFKWRKNSNIFYYIYNKIYVKKYNNLIKEIKKELYIWFAINILKNIFQIFLSGPFRVNVFIKYQVGRK